MWHYLTRILVFSCKGSSIIRMLDHFVGVDKFKAGLKVSILSPSLTGLDILCSIYSNFYAIILVIIHRLLTNSLIVVNFVCYYIILLLSNVFLVV